jgi:hypothetical protein
MRCWRSPWISFRAEIWLRLSLLGQGQGASLSPQGHLSYPK